MSIFLIKLEVGNIHMYDDWSIVHDIVMHILKIFYTESQFLDSVKKKVLFLLMKFFTDSMHVIHCIDLQLTASLEGLIPFTFEE